MNATVIKLRFTNMDKLLDEVEQEKFDEVVLVGFKGDTYEMFCTEIKKNPASSVRWRSSSMNC